MDEKRMRLRYAGTCRVCEAELPAKTEAIYERETKTVRCLGHEPLDVPEQAVEVDPGVPGASARREFERRAARREAKIREAHPRIGGFIHAVTDDPQSTRAWNVGALGEERLGARLNELSGDVLRVLHDRRIPGTQANIDHLAVTPTGVYVIDAKKYAGRPHLVVEGGILRPRVEKLMVGRRNCTKLVDGMHKQVEIVAGVLGDDAPVHGVLCFVEAEWPLIGGAFRTRDVLVVWPKKLYPKLQSEGPLDAPAIGALHGRLARSLPLA